jgi:hypothetical protein
LSDTGEKNGDTMRQYISYSRTTRKTDSVRMNVLYNILIEFGAPMKLVRLIKMHLNETYSKHLSASFPIQNGLKQRDALSILLFNSALEHTIRKVQENYVGLKLNRTHQLLAYTDDVNLLGDNIDTIMKKTETLIDASKEISLDINTEQTNCICCYLVTRMQVRITT